MRDPLAGKHAHTVLIEAQGTDESIDGPRFESFLAAMFEEGVIEDAALLEPGEQERLEAGIAALEAAKSGENHTRINDAIQKLDELSLEFAGRRMNRSIAAALGGKSVDFVDAPTQGNTEVPRP